MCITTDLKWCGYHWSVTPNTNSARVLLCACIMGVWSSCLVSQIILTIPTVFSNKLPLLLVMGYTSCTLICSQPQYAFLYEVLSEALTCGNTTISCSNFSTQLTLYKQVCSYYWYSICIWTRQGGHILEQIKKWSLCVFQNSSFSKIASHMGHKEVKMLLWSSSWNCWDFFPIIIIGRIWLLGEWHSGTVIFSLSISWFHPKGQILFYFWDSVCCLSMRSTSTYAVQYYRCKTVDILNSNSSLIT